MRPVPRILITPGEPAGIGPDIVVRAAQKDWLAELIVVGDPDLLLARAAKLKAALTIEPIDFVSSPQKHQAGKLKIIPVKLKTDVTPGVLNAQNAPYVLRCLEIATDYCLANTAQAMVTGPVHKGVMNDAGIVFTGHTEFLAARTHTAKALMLFMVDTIKVALATVHLPLAKVSAAITISSIVETVSILQKALQSQFNVQRPRILVCGLNPHAGENGHLGREEIETIIPALTQLKTANIDVIGPLPADTVFTPERLNMADAVLAMYHDQALPVIKYIGFDRAVNVTLGLPIIRTSVDHGTALDIAGTHKSNPGSLIAAIKLAIEMISKE